MYTKKRIKLVTAVLLFTIMMTACTSKEDVVLELENQGSMQTTFSENTAGEAEDEPEPEQVSAHGKVPEQETELNQTKSQTVDEKNVQKIYVHIYGAVISPGVYELENGSRVYMVIEAAGGFLENACEDYVNQAAVLQDGQKVMIPTKEEVEIAKEEGIFPEEWASGEMSEQLMETVSGKTTSDTGSSEDGRVNINTATESELCTINGIGEGRAAAIVKYRQENGSFASIEEIMQVSGIKEGTYEKIKDQITVN